LALARSTVPMEKVKLFRAEMDLVNIAMLFPMEEMGAEGGPEVPRLGDGMSNFMVETDSVRKSGEEQGEVGEEEEVEEVEEEVDEGELEEGKEEEVEVEVGISGSPDSVMVARLVVTRPISSRSNSSPDSDSPAPVSRFDFHR